MRYLNVPAVRNAAARRVAHARLLWREARRARQSGWPDVAATRETHARRLLAVARWCAANCPTEED